MTTFKLFEIILSLVALALSFYAVKLGFAEFIKWLARKKVLCVFLKENRIVQIDDGTKFNEFVLSKRGYSFAFQAEPDKDDWVHEKDRWKIVANKHYNLEDSFTGFQKWCMKKLGIYWFGGFLLGKKVRIRKVRLFTYNKETNVIEAIEPDSEYLFATDTVYAWEIRHAEDIAGNSFRIPFSVIACVNNPYIAWIENERWDDTFATKAMSAPIHLIKNLPFHVLTPAIKNKMEDAKDKDGEKVNYEEIAEQFTIKVKEELDKIDIGLEFKSVELYNVDPENPDLFDVFLDLYQAEFEAAATVKRARGEADGKALILEVERDDIDLRLQAMDSHPESARLLAMEKTFKNVTILGSESLAVLVDPNSKTKEK